MITPQALVQAGLYPNEQTVIEEALRILWQERPRLRLDWAVYQYKTQDISLAKAAAIAGVSFDQMKETVRQRGIPLRLGPETVEEARQELTVIEQTLTGRD